jgi:serine/threonine-protein kinase
VDNYALGLVLYEALTAHSAYRGGSITEVVERHLTRIPVKPAVVDAELWRIVEMLLSLDPRARGDLDAIAAELRRLAPRLSNQATAPIAPQLKERDATASFKYEPVTPHAGEQGAPGAMLAAPSDGNEPRGEVYDSGAERLGRGWLVGLVAAGCFVVFAAVWAFLVVTRPDLPDEDDVADPSGGVSASVTAEADSSGEPTEPGPEESGTPGEETTTPQGPDVESDMPDQESDEMSESEGNDDDSTEGGSDDDSPGSDLIGSPMPDN